MIAAGSIPSLHTVLKAVADIRLKYQPSTIRVGRYDNRHAVEVHCETQPVCEQYYLHRLRKTAATNWVRSGFELMKIRSWLGHTSLKVTQIYLDSEMHDPEEQTKLDRAGKF